MPDEPNTTEAPLAFRMLNLNGRPWAMPRTNLHDLAEACAQLDLEAVVARSGQPLDKGSGVTTQNGTALVNVRGPLFRYRSIWTWLLGGTSVEETALALHAAVDDPGVHRIVLAINSPGGQIDGIHEMANMIRAANQAKPVTAYVDGLGASGAYWLASAAGRIVADETAQIGSIGVVATMMDDSAMLEKHGVKRYEFVSSQSPLKRTDPGTAAGRAQVQQMVDALAQVFIDKVAKFRGTTAAKVERDFGQGAVMPAREAVSVGMADALGSLEELLSANGRDAVRLIQNQPGLGAAADSDDANDGAKRALAAVPPGVPSTSGDAESDDTPCDCPPGGDCDCEDEEASVQGEGDLMTPTEDRQRIAAILTCEEAKGREELARTLALETNHTLDAVQKLLKAAPTAATANALDTRMREIPNPKVGIGADGIDDSAAAEVARILAFVPTARKYPVKVQ